MGDPIPTSPDSAKKTGIPVVPNIFVPRYDGHPDIVKVYPDTNPQKQLTVTPPTEVPRVKTTLPQK